MKFLYNLDDIQKSFLITTLFVIGISSINTGSINIGSLSFLIVSFLLLLFYFFTYKLMNLISYSAIQISSLIVLFYLKKTIYSSIPVPIYLIFLLLIFLLIIMNFFLYCFANNNMNTREYIMDESSGINDNAVFIFYHFDLQKKYMYVYM